jgi:NACHT domain
VGTANRPRRRGPFRGQRAHGSRVGAVALVLFVVAVAAALILAWLYHLGVPATLVGIILGVPSLYLGWVALQDERRPPDRSLAQIADGLAGRLRSQWIDEAKARGLNDPYPLPVAWTAADAPLAGDLDALKRLATSGAGWSASARDHWAKGPEDLVGGGGRKLADVLAMVPTGRLVVLGEPGAGKTMLMVRLVLDLLDPNRRSGQPIPVLASLASWDPVSQDLHGWLAATLITAYPDLAGAPPPGSAGDNRFEALVEAGLILPVLDGLDEFPESARAVAITRINKELKPGEQVVVTCRTEQYRAAVSPHDSPGAVLRAASVQLSTLEFGEVASYLRKDAGPAAEGRWDFLNTLSIESPVRQALATPLMAGLARAIYNPRPDERARDLGHPAELCNFADRSAVESLLFDAFIPAAYQNDPPGRWKAQDAEKWLMFLARHLERTIGGADLAWWQLRDAAPPGAFGLVAGLWAVLGFGSAKAPARGMRISIKGFRAGFAAGQKGGLVVGLVGGLAAGLVAGLRVGLVHGLEIGVAGVLGFGFTGEVLLGITGGLAGGLAAVPGDLAGVTSPGTVLARDRQVALLLVLMTGLELGIVAGLLFGYAGLVARLLFGLAGLVVGLWFGLGLSRSQTAWPSYMLTRGWLAFHHHLPWSLMSFLSDAHQRGVLRQAGAVYQFRHIELQRRLVNRSH